MFFLSLSGTFIDGHLKRSVLISNSLVCLFLFAGLSADCQTIFTGDRPDTTICKGSSFTLTLSSRDVNAYYIWNTGETDQQITINEPGTYWVTSFTDDGIMQTDTFHIQESECAEVHVLIPTAFSPNDDGLNDELHIFMRGETELISFVVFDRRGNAVFETSDPSFGWDGRYRSVLLSKGMYVYFISYRMKGSEQILSLRGEVTLIR